MLRSPRSRASERTMHHVRPSTSPRPTVVLDPAAFGVGDPTRALVGRPRALGRERVLFALPLDPSPALLQPPTLLRADGPAYVADPDGVLVGVPALWVSRMLTARTTEDTRRLG